MGTPRWPAVLRCAFPCEAQQKRSERVLDHLRERLLDADGDALLVSVERFQRIELGLDKVGGHEVIATGGHTRGDDFERRVQVHEDHLASGNAQSR